MKFPRRRFPTNRRLISSLFENSMAPRPRLWHIAILLAAECSSGRSQTQTPAAPPASLPQTAPAPAPAAPTTSASTAGVSMVQDILASLARFDQEGRPDKQKIGFEIPERAFNDYLAYSLRTHPRPGINTMTVTLLPSNQISAETEIDFDAVQQWNPDIFPELLRPLFHGKKTIKTDVDFQSSGGTCSFNLKNALGPDGKTMVNKLMSTLLQTLGSQQPESYDTSKPLPLPYGLKRIWTEKQLLCGET